MSSLPTPGASTTSERKGPLTYSALASRLCRSARTAALSPEGRGVKTGRPLVGWSEGPLGIQRGKVVVGWSEGTFVEPSPPSGERAGCGGGHDDARFMTNHAGPRSVAPRYLS